MQLDFFKNGNELKQKSKQELLKEITECEKRNKEIINDLKIKKDTYLKNIINDLNSFLTENLSFVLTIYKDDRLYEFLKNNEEYKIKLSSYFISYYNSNRNVTYAYTLSYRDDDLEFKRLHEDEYLEKNLNYSPYNNMDISQLSKLNDYSKQILEDNTKYYNEIKELPLNDLFAFYIKESNASISRDDKDIKKYNCLVDFIKEIL